MLFPNLTILPPGCAIWLFEDEAWASPVDGDQGLPSAATLTLALTLTLTLTLTLIQDKAIPTEEELRRGIQKQRQTASSELMQEAPTRAPTRAPAPKTTSKQRQTGNSKGSGSGSSKLAVGVGSGSAKISGTGNSTEAQKETALSTLTS